MSRRSEGNSMKRSVGGKKTRRIVTKNGLAEFGIKELMLAVLENSLDAYKDGLTSPVAGKRVEAFKVEAWVASDDTEWPFSFLNVCQHVGVSPEYVRTCMKQWRRAALSDDDDLVH